MMNKYKVFSQNKPGVMYIISETDSGHLSCSCPAASFKPGPCKHVESFKALSEDERARLLLDPNDYERLNADVEHVKNMDKIRPTAAQKNPFDSLPTKPKGYDKGTGRDIARKGKRSVTAGLADISITRPGK